MAHSLRCSFVAFALVAGACNTSPPACDRLGQAYCEAADIDCTMSKTLFTAAGLPAARCEEAIETLRGLMPMLSPDMRGVALAVFLREVMRDSPKMSEAQLDALGRAIGLPDVPAPGGSGPQAGAQSDVPDPPADTEFDTGGMPQNIFVGYSNMPEPPAEPAVPAKK